jgi:ABC-type multidrug transport system fused ATPase/permease subunit
VRTLTREVMELLGAGTRRRWVGLVVLAVIVSVVDAVGAGLVYTLLKIVTQEGARVELPLIGDVREQFSSLDERELVRLAVAVVGAFFAARGVLYLAQSYLQNRIAYNTGVALSGRLLRGYLAGTYTDHLRRSTATSIRNAHESVQLLVQQVLVPGVGLISEGMLILVVFLVMLAVAPVPTGLTLVVLVPLIALLVRGLQPHLVRYGTTSQEMSTASLQALTQTLGGFREIKMHGRETFFERRFSVSRAALARAFYLRSFLLDVPRVGVETGLVLFILVFIAASVGDDGPDDSTITILGFFGYAGLRVLPSLNRIMTNLQQIRFGTPLIGQLFEDVTAADAAVVASAAAGPVVPVTFERAVRLEAVSVRYEGADRMALVDVDLELRRGEWLGVVGPTGGGKSTLVDVVTGFLPPTTGRVLVDGIDIWPDPRGWRERIGIVPQAIFLVDDSIRCNVALGFEEGEIDDERVTEALRLARLDGWVAQLPEGVHAQVGERGVKVSGGQRQRIAIARALYHRPDVVVFDEGTSALDRATESEVIDALQQLRGGRTLVTVAHRLSTIRSCDRIAVVDDGRVVATGSYDELASSSDAFRALNP